MLLRKKPNIVYSIMKNDLGKNKRERERGGGERERAEKRRNGTQESHRGVRVAEGGGLTFLVDVLFTSRSS